AADAEGREERGAEGIVAEQTVQIGAGDQPVAGACAFPPVSYGKERPRAIRPARPAEMDFITGDRLASQDMPAGHRGHDLVALEHALDIEKPEAGDAAGLSLAPLRIVDHPPEHLVAAAQTEHAPATPVMRTDVDVPALRAQEGEIGHGRFR